MPESNGKTKLFQMYDRKAETMTGPILAYNREGPAIRDFHTVLANRESHPGMYPEDYELRQIGYQDETTGEIQSEIRTIATGEAWLAGLETPRVKEAFSQGAPVR